MSPKAGDRIEVTSNTLGVVPRHGIVLSATAGGGLRVRWDDGRETTFMPGSSCRVLGATETAPGPVRLGCHVDVHIVEDGDECRATASIATSRGMLQARGVARRRAGDPPAPMIGEELAIGRALGALSEQLISAATDHLSQRPSDQDHLVP